jgi:hypothetical protein
LDDADFDARQCARNAYGNSELPAKWQRAQGKATALDSGLRRNDGIGIGNGNSNSLTLEK